MEYWIIIAIIACAYLAITRSMQLSLARKWEEAKSNLNDEIERQKNKQSANLCYKAPTEISEILDSDFKSTEDKIRLLVLVKRERAAFINYLDSNKIEAKKYGAQLIKARILFSDQNIPEEHNEEYYTVDILYKIDSLLSKNVEFHNYKYCKN